MTKKEGLKAAVTTGAGLCSGYTIDKVTNGVIPNLEGMPMPAKIAIKIGSWVIGAALGQWVGDQTEKTYDAVAEMVEKGKEAVKEMAEENAENGEEAATA